MTIGNRCCAGLPTGHGLPYFFFGECTVMRVAISGLYHEANTFALEHNDKLDAELKVGQDVIDKSHPKSFIGGFVEGMQGSGIELVPTAEARFHHGGLVHADVFEHYRDLIV